jgi:hypothetical protein
VKHGLWSETRVGFEGMQHIVQPTDVHLYVYIFTDLASEQHSHGVYSSHSSYSQDGYSSANRTTSSKHCIWYDVHEVCYVRSVEYISRGGTEH